MSNKFAIPFDQDEHELLAKFKAAAAKNGVAIECGQNLGRFSGTGIKGHFIIKDKVLTVTIEKKPMLIAMSMIEKKLRDFVL